VAYAENFRGGPQFRHNRVTSQINFRGSAGGTIILGGPGACPRENIAKLHIKIRIFGILEASFRPGVTNLFGIAGHFVSYRWVSGPHNFFVIPWSLLKTKKIVHIYPVVIAS